MTYLGSESNIDNLLRESKEPSRLAKSQGPCQFLRI